MSTTPLKLDILEEGARPRDWQPRKSHYKVPLRLLRLCLLGMFLPSVLIAGPMYLRYRVYSEQLYPLAVSDQRLIDARVSTTWCQSQIVKVNATFNAYLMSDKPKMENEALPVSMTRHLILEDDMKEYWGFYLLRGSSVTVSTCVRWPGASLTMIRGHKHLHECAFIGDDSSEEIDEILEVARENGLLAVNGTEDGGPSNEPEKMKRAQQGVHFHHGEHGFPSNHSSPTPHHHSSHELDAKAMRTILSQLFVKTLDTKKKQKENPHHHYEGVFVETANIDKPPTATVKYPFGLNTERPESPELTDNVRVKAEAGRGKFSNASREKQGSSRGETRMDNLEKIENRDEKRISAHRNEEDSQSSGTRGEASPAEDGPTPLPAMEGLEVSTQKRSTVSPQDNVENTEASSAEVFQDILHKISSLGHRGKKMLQKLMAEIEGKGDEGEALRRMVNETMNDASLSKQEKLRRRRDLVLSSPLQKELTEEDEDGDMAIEEGMLHPDGIAEDRGTVNESTLNDRSNSEFWSSFSSSEERLLECKGLILNLPLTPHRHCTPKYESQHQAASFANTVTYRVPVDGYYFFVFNSENEIQPNYVRVKFDLLKTVYNISNPVHACKNSTQECSLPFKIFSNERTVLELPLSGNDSQWNEEYVVVSTCEPRTAIYLICIITVPLLILVFAFH